MNEVIKRAKKKNQARKNQPQSSKDGKFVSKQFAAENKDETIQTQRGVDKKVLKNVLATLRLWTARVDHPMLPALREDLGKMESQVAELLGEEAAEIETEDAGEAEAA